MNNKMKRLEIESMLNQIYRNKYIYDGPFCSFSFEQVYFIALNFINIYTKDVTIDFQEEYLRILAKDLTIEIKYHHIKSLSINFREIKV